MFIETHMHIYCQVNEEKKINQLLILRGFMSHLEVKLALLVFVLKDSVSFSEQNIKDRML